MRSCGAKKRNREVQDGIKIRTPNGKEKASAICRRVCLENPRQVSMPSFGSSGLSECK